jgi:hypothetical protein
MTTKEPYEHFNDLLESAKQTTTCDARCQFLKQSKVLKDQYEESEVNVLTAPQKEEIAQKKLMVFTQGQDKYNQFRDNKLKQKADKIIQLYVTNVIKELKRIYSSIETYDNLLLNYNNILELYKKYKEENTLLKKKIKMDSNDILTNERKTFYEDQGNDVLHSYYYILLVLYVVTIIAFLVSIFIFPSDFNIAIKIGILVALIILFFASSYILSSVIGLFYAVYEVLPKNMNLTA